MGWWTVIALENLAKTVVGNRVLKRVKYGEPYLFSCGEARTAALFMTYLAMTVTPGTDRRYAQNYQLTPLGETLIED